MSSPQDEIPAAISIPTDSLLLKLLEACAKHKRHHEADNETTSDLDGRMDKVCENALSSLANILPRMENTITVPDTSMDVYLTSSMDDNNTHSSKRREGNNMGEDIHHLCALYRAIARSSFCPHASSFLLDNHTISSRIVRLLGYLVMDPVGAAEVGDTAAEVGNAIVALLDTNEKSKRGALSDLILLVDDLNTVDESGVLVNPNNGGGKISIHILSSMGSNNTIELVSKRSLLSLQLGVWCIIRACIPSIDYSFVGKLSHGEYVDIDGMVDEVIAASQRALLAGKRNEEGETNLYSNEDLRIHSRLILKTKVVISSMLQSITGGNLSHCGGTSLYTAQLGNPSPRYITLALLAIEAAKSHLMWNQDNVNITDSAELELQCSQSLAKFMLCTLSTRGICMHSLPYIVDLLPYLVNQQDSTLPRVVLRILHLYLHQYNEATVLLKRRCLAQCYFPLLFQLTCDSECFAVVAVSIIRKLIDNSRDELKYFVFVVLPVGSTRENEVEKEEQASVQGRKRRRINDESSNTHVTQGASIHSTLSHFVANAIAKADNLISSIDARGNKCSPVTSPIIAEDVPIVKVVSGILRILLSLPTSIEGADEAIRRLFSCIYTISQTLVSHEQKSNCYIEPKTLGMCLELIVSVGYHAYHRDEHMQSVYRSERESISHCAVANQPLIDSNEVIEIVDEIAIELLTYSGRAGVCCRGACSRLCSLIGAKAAPPSDICICSLGSVTRNHECGEFLLRDLLPLKFR